MKEPDTEEPAIENEEEPTEESGWSGDRSLLRLPGHRPVSDTRADNALNVTTAADIAALYSMLVNGQIVNDDASQEMLRLLESQQINDRLPAYLPEGTVVAHKTGNLDGLVHDAGVIFAPAGPVIVVVLTEDVPESAGDRPHRHHRQTRLRRQLVTSRASIDALGRTDAA